MKYKPISIEEKNKKIKELIKDLSLIDTLEIAVTLIKATLGIIPDGDGFKPILKNFIMDFIEKDKLDVENYVKKFTEIIDDKCDVCGASIKTFKAASESGLRLCKDHMYTAHKSSNYNN